MLHTDPIARIPDLLHRHAVARGDKIAYRDAQTSVTYAGLLERTGKLASHLADHGISPGDTVAIMLPNSVQWVESCSPSPAPAPSACQSAATPPKPKSPIGSSTPTAKR